MKVKIYNENYNLPTITPCGDYRYAKNVFCQCETEYQYKTYVNTVKQWIFDGIYVSNIGELICFTCPICGDKFMFHVRDYETWGNYGFFDNYKAMEE